MHGYNGLYMVTGGYSSLEGEKSVGNETMVIEGYEWL